MRIWKKYDETAVAQSESKIKTSSLFFQKSRQMSSNFRHLLITDPTKKAKTKEAEIINTLTKSNSSMSSAEIVVKTTLGSSQVNEEIKISPGTSKQTVEEFAECARKSSPKERFKFRKLMPISKASVLSNNLSQQESCVENSSSNPINTNRPISYVNSTTNNKINSRLYKPLGIPRGLTTLDSSAGQQLSNNETPSFKDTTTENETLPFFNLNRFFTNAKTNSNSKKTTTTSSNVIKSYQSDYFKNAELVYKLKKKVIYLV